MELLCVLRHALISNFGRSFAHGGAVSGIQQDCLILCQRHQMGRTIIGADQKLFLHMIQPDVHARHPQEISLCIPDRRDNADHHNIFAHQLINIGIHDIQIARLFDLHIILFLIIVKGILMFFKHISCILLIGIYHGFISDILLMAAVRLSVSVCNRILFKICKSSRKSVPAFQKPY